MHFSMIPAPDMAKPRKKKNKRAAAPAPAVPGKKWKKSSRRMKKSNGAAAPTCGCGDQNRAGLGEGLAGFIFMCDGKTKPECFRNRVFGLPERKAEVVEKIRAGAVLFLFDVELKILYGVYQATSNGGVNLVPGAFGGEFPAQVKFKIDKDCLPLHEIVFKQAIQENYRSKKKFRPELNSQQVNKLLSLFHPVTLLPQPPPPQIVEDHHLRPPSHLPHSEDPHRSRFMTSVPPSPDRRYAPQIGPPPANEQYIPAAHYVHVPPLVDPQHVPPTAHSPPNDPCHPAPLTDPYYQREHMRRYYPENPIPYERGGYRAVPEMIPRDQLPSPPLQSHWVPGCQDPNCSYTGSYLRPAVSRAANMENAPGPSLCSCGAVAQAYR